MELEQDLRAADAGQLQKVDLLSVQHNGECRAPRPLFHAASVLSSKVFSVPC